MILNPIESGCWYTYPTPSEKYIFVSWDDDSSQLFLESHNPVMFQTTNQESYWVRFWVNDPP